MSEKKEFDVVVVGAGPAGYPAAIRAARLGASVAVVEDKALGGTCLNVGCIPTKYFCKRAAAKDPRPWAEVVAEKDKVVAELVRGVAFLFQKRGITTFKGRGSVTVEGDVLVDGPDNVVLAARKGILYAPGSVPVNVPALPVDHQIVLDSDDLLNDVAVFDKLVIVGAGAIGLEWATIYHRRGVAVTVVEMMPQVLPGLDGDLSRRLASLMKRAGINILLETKVEAVTVREGGTQLRLSGGSSLGADRVLVAVGRKANVDAPALSLAGIALEGNRVRVNDRMETTKKGVWAAGDAAGTAPMLAHVATRQGIVAVSNMLGRECRWRDDLTPWAVFSDPEAAGVGSNAEQAAARGAMAREGRVDYRALGRPHADGYLDGFFKVLADGDGRVLGAHALGHNAAELVQIIGAAMACGATIGQLEEFVAIHPTYSELVAEAVEDWRGLATHKP